MVESANIIPLLIKYKLEFKTGTKMNDSEFRIMVFIVKYQIYTENTTDWPIIWLHQFETAYYYFDQALESL